MNKVGPSLTGLYRYTSMGRPIDPAYLTNRALLFVLPLLAIASAAVAYVFDTGVSPVAASLGGALVAFAAWALSRELAPDSDSAAFVALAFAWAANVTLGTSQVMLVFVALLLARVVNRSTGLPSRPLDTIGILGFCAWAAVSTQQPFVLLVASVAFALDGVLEKPLRHHLLAAATCLSLFGWLVIGGSNLLANDLTMRDWALLGAVALGVVLVVSTSRPPISYCDVSPERLDRSRVSAGLVVGALIAAQALVTGGHSAWLETPIWVSVIAALLFSLVRRADRPQGTAVAS